MTLYIAIAALIVAAVCLVLLIVVLVKLGRSAPAKLSDAVADEVTQRENLMFTALKADIGEENRASRTEMNAAVQTSMKSFAEVQTTAINQQFRTFSEQNKASLDTIRATVQGQLETLQKDNHAQLDQMRQTVDEKLQKTLESENVLIHYDESMVPDDFSDIGKYNPSEDVRHA